MKTTKKLFVICLILVMLAVAAMPSTFSWYAHSGDTHYQGNYIEYVKEDLPLSLKQSNNVTVQTRKADEFSKQTGNALSSFTNINAGKTQRYITTISNPGTKDIYTDLEISKITNDANVFVGTISPVVNEKSFASRAMLEKVDWDYEVIYFEPRNHYSWWQNYNEPPITYDNDDNDPDTVTGDNDMNLEYQIGNEGTMMGMEKCPDPDPVPENDTTVNYDVYRAFVTTEADSLFFFNHYYVTESTNLEWNRTPAVTDFAEGRVYYLNGDTNDYNNKDISYHDSYNGTNLCVYYYYKTVTMAIGKTANIGLKKGSSDMIANREEFDYTGKSISYASNDTSVATVSKDGLITAKGAGDCKITTTIRGEFGDKLNFETTVKIPPNIDQVPIAQNIKVPAGESVDVVWYVRNASSASAGFSNVFCTV